MATDTVPASVPGPNDPHGNTADPATTIPQPGGLAGLLAPVEPVRSAAFSLDPQQNAAPAEWAGVGVSSASYTSPDTPQPGTDSTTGKGSAARQQTGVVRAWLLAGAERWKQGGVARNKRYDYLKAKAAASQVKTTRTESVNNSGGFLGNARTPSSGKSNGKGSSGNQSAGSGKGLKTGKKTPQGPSRLNGGSNGSSGASGSSGGNGRSGAGHQGGSGNHRDASRTPSPRKPHTPKDTPKHGNDRLTKDNPGSDGSKGSGGNTKASSGGRSTAGKDGDRGPKGTSGTNTAGKGQDQGRDTKTPKTNDTRGPKPDTGFKKDLTKPVASATGDKTSTPRTPDAPGPKPKTGTTPDTRKDLKKTPSKDTKTGPQDGKTDAPTPTKTPTPDATSTDNTTPADKTKKTPDTPGKPAPGRRLNLQDSRETGYRDGTRAAKITSHIEAWRDGARDGWTDTREDATREKTRLDTAHADHKQATDQAQQPKDTPVPQTATSVDYQAPIIPPAPTEAPGPRPVSVRGIDANTVYLGTGARPGVTRGEVRTLRRFQQRLEQKTATLTRMAEATRALEQHAQEQAVRVIQLLEQAKGVKGGEKLVGKLTKLADDATNQAGQAADIHKRATRAADFCRAVLANVETRYGGIYKAVVDSAETSPAELAYYREMGHV